MNAANEELGEIAAAAAAARATPFRALLPGAAAHRFAAVTRRAAELSCSTVRLRAAYSVKTNPDPALLDEARRSGMWAETIGPQEYALARERGFAAAEIIYNGPVPFDATWGGTACAFADTPAVFERYCRDGAARIPGVRLRPTGVVSRFGVTAGEVSDVADILQRRRPAEIGVSFHLRASDITAPRTWGTVFDEVIDVAAGLEAATGVHVAVLDIGGGRDPAAFDALLNTEVAFAMERVRRRLPYVTTVLMEPGQEVATPCSCLVTSVIDVRSSRSPREVVIDANVMQLSYRDHYRHRAFAYTGGALHPLPSGSDRILGSACLEDDVFSATVGLPPLVCGDRIIFADCGSYDTSMASPFATGALASV